MRATSIFDYDYGNMFSKLKSMLNNGLNKTKGIIWQNDDRPGTPVSYSGLACRNSDSYDNAFPDIVRIAEAFAEVMPYAVDEKGRRLAKQPQLMRALYNPNEEMSGSDFLETLITMLLVHPLVHILVWHYENGKPVPGGPITPDNIAGFTFLEKAAVSRIDGRTTFRLRDRDWTRKDVITLSLNVNPYRIIDGYSPTQAIKKWATVDDYIAEYQSGQFANGGVPAGLMTITAPTVDEYNKAVDRMIASYTGPNNANRIVYTHRPTSSIDGKPEQAGVEWTPFAQTNKDLTLDALFNQANKKIDMNFGVPEEIKGYLQNSNYASAEVADYVFARRILYPKLVKVYSKLTHEFNRITGGARFAIGFDFELPVLTDTRKVQTDTLIEMLDAGFTVESSVEALRLPKSFLKLNKTQETLDENLQVEDMSREKPSQAQTSKSAHPDHCGHSHKSAENWEGVINPSLKALINIYILHLLSLVQEGLTNVDNANKAINKAKAVLKSNPTLKTLRTLITASIYYQLALNDTDSAKAFANQLGMARPVLMLDDEELSAFNFSVQSATALAKTRIESGLDLDSAITPELTTMISVITKSLTEQNIRAAIEDFAEGNTYEKQLNYLLIKFAGDTLDNWQKEIQDVEDTTEAIAIIQNFIASQNYRVNRWALTEQHRGEELGKLLATKDTADVAEMEPYKVWRIRKGACEHCVALAGETVRADQTFSNGNMVPADHPNCRCYFDVIFRPIAKSVKVTCPSCGRYMMESNGGVMKNVICANSKCKKHYDIEVKDGDIKATERKVV